MKYSEDLNKHNISGLPPQNLPSTEKTPQWGNNCVRAIHAMGSGANEQGRSSKENKAENYDLVNSIFNMDNMEHVLNPYGIDSSKFGGTATKMQNYNIIRSRLETLRGEEMNSPLNFFVYAISGEAVSAKKAKRKEMLREMMRAHIRAEYQLDQQIAELEQTIEQLQQQVQKVQDTAKVQQLQQQLEQLQQQRNNMPDVQADMKKFKSSYTDPTEQTNNKILRFLKKNDRLELKFNQGWFHALVSSEEVYYTDIHKGHPTARPVNPLNFEFDKGANTTFIHKGAWAREEFWLPKSEVIDLVGDVLTDEEVEKIESGNAGHSFMYQGTHQGFVYNFDGGQRRTTNFNNGNQGGSHVYVMQCAWRSSVKQGILHYRDPRSNKMETTEVDDTFELTPELKELGAYVEWFWDTEIWEGTMIGDSIFCNVRPRSNQTKNLPYVGYIYNNVNSTATSMVDLAKAHQYTYIIVWWRLEQEIAKAKGKKFVMDFAQLPKSVGWDVEQWMYYFENMGVIWINSVEEGRKGDPSTQSQFNQFQSIDMSLSQVVPQYMQILAKLEQLVEDIMGVSPQRMGNIQASETATGAQTAVSRSTNVTKPWFYFHDLVKEEVLNEMLELAKIAYIDGGELELVLTDDEIVTIQIDGDKLNNSDMGVFITNSFEDRVKKEKIIELLSAAVQQGKARLLDVANALDADSMSYVKAKLEEGEMASNEAAQASNKATLEAQEKERERESREKELDRTKDVVIQDSKNATDLAIKKLDLVALAQGDRTELDTLKVIQDSIDSTRKLDLEETKESNRTKEKQQELKQKDHASKTGN